jgi:N-acetylmuramoyl-L-alanine amidase
MPHVAGPLAIRVVYPRADALVDSRDSNFIFGSVGHGDAMLRINGHPVDVQPNGTFIAFLPVPRSNEPEYLLVATAGADSASYRHPVRVPAPRPVLALDGPLVVDSASLRPTGTSLQPADESVRVSVRAPANARVWLALPGGESRALVGAAALPPGAGAGLDANLFATTVRAGRLADGGSVVVARGADTVRLPVAPLATITPDDARWMVLAPASRVAGDTDKVVSARPTQGGTNRWLLLPGTRMEMTARSGEQVRLRLDDRVQGWVAASEVQPLPAGMAPPARTARSIRVAPDSGWVDLVIAMTEPAAHLVEAEADGLSLLLYDTRSEIDNVRYLAPDSFVQLVDWSQESDRRVRIRIRTAHAPLGYQAIWREGAFVLRVRRPPAVDPDMPLRGITIAVDAGHPPGGATGPGGLAEADAVLPIAERLRVLLEERGASVVMTRTSLGPVELYDRPMIARRAGAHALVSIHLNALPDGVNPFTAHGTSTYFFHAHSAPLARAVQAGMLAHLGLRDLGVFRGDLVLTRPTWMPAILCEGAFIMMPEQEWLVRTTEGQDSYARGVADGVEMFFRELGAGGAGASR